MGTAVLMVLAGCSTAAQPVPTLTAVPGVVRTYVDAVVANDAEAASASVTYLAADGAWIHGGGVSATCVDRDFELWAEYDLPSSEISVESSRYDDVELEPGAAPVDVVVSKANFEFDDGEIVGRGLQWIDNEWFVEIDGTGC